MARARTRKLEAAEIAVLALFAPPNCTGNSGVIGDTILHTSLVRTLLDRSLFPRLSKLHWWGSKWVVDTLFDYLTPHVEIHDWDGRPAGLPSAGQLTAMGVEAGIICTRDEAIFEILASTSNELPLYKPTKPLNAQASEHLTVQLHSALEQLGIRVAIAPRPRIHVSEEQFRAAQRKIKPSSLQELSTHKVIGDQEFDPEFDKIFLLSPAISRSEDERTWSKETWAHLAHLLAAVGPVIVQHDPRPGTGDHRLAAAEVVEGAVGRRTIHSRFAVGLELPEIAAWACNSTVVIARDSGPLHVAAAAQGPWGRPNVLALFSIMRPETWRPLSDQVTIMGEWPIPLQEYVTPQEVAVCAARYVKKWHS